MIKVLAYLILIVFLFVSCRSPSALQIKPSPEVKATEKEKPMGEWEKTLVLAKKEGKLRIFTSLEPNVIKPVAEDFKNKFGLDVEYIAGRGPDIIPKLKAERRANLFTTDVYIGGTDPIVFMMMPDGLIKPLKPELFLPEVLDTKVWYNNRLPWVDKEESFILQTKGGPEPGEVVINTGLMKKSEITSYYDFLQTRFKGKINMTDPTISGRGNKWFGAVLFFKSLDLDYMRALAKQDLVLTRDKRLQIEWVAKGKHLATLLPNSPQYREFLDAGAPLDYLRLKESKLMLGGGSSGLSLIDRAPDPQAARLFVNWFLSREGQTYFSRVFQYQSFRLDVPTNHLDPKQVREPGVNYSVETEEFLSFVNKASEQSREIFGPLLK